MILDGFANMQHWAWLEEEMALSLTMPIEFTAGRAWVQSCIQQEGCIENYGSGRVMSNLAKFATGEQNEIDSGRIGWDDDTWQHHSPAPGVFLKEDVFSCWHEKVLKIMQDNMWHQLSAKCGSVSRRRIDFQQRLMWDGRFCENRCFRRRCT